MLKSTVFYLSLLMALSSQAQSVKREQNSASLPTSQTPKNIISILTSAEYQFLNSKSLFKAEIESNRKKVFFFFASYCSYCETEMPKFNQLGESLRECGYGLYPVSVDSELTEAQKVTSEWKIQLPTIWDHDGLIRKHFGIKRTPHIMVTNSAGEVTHEASGSGQFQALINELAQKCNREAS